MFALLLPRIRVLAQTAPCTMAEYVSLYPRLVQMTCRECLLDPSYSVYSYAE